MFESIAEIDNLRLNFSPNSIHILNIVIGFLMFGVALELKIDNFKRIISYPKTALTGLISQFLLLPLFTFLLVKLLNPQPGIALGMILVAACPGGNISNFITAFSKGNVELAVSMTAIGTILAIVLTPFNFGVWGALYNASSPLLRPIQIDVLQMFYTVFIILGIPIILGMTFSYKYPRLAQKLLKPAKLLALLIFIAFVIGALHENFDYFIKYVYWIAIIVFLHNALMLIVGYYTGVVAKLPKRDCRTLAIETGIHNTGLGLALIFNPKIFPPDLGLGGMAFVAAWYGIWHMVSGLAMAAIWRQKRFNGGL